ncbi:TetR/AcrR family transcriptional regulator [Bradyrhizobium sp. ORS 285]|uniref:TetR/AcrR family transcriptional regulator n=1 Tax=Bradyrhizobium sp. ORS 285 TaxID=115808 RepID=UPI0018D5A668|nr:TetR/AcrR family transcriptional regulator [Bradyrhizobium sp. ORS 285]
MTDAEDGLRADARANRAKIVDVAREALARDPAVSLNAIAKAADVGPGTLYRHFPNREALVLAVYRREIEAVAAVAQQLVVRHPPREAFRRWCERLAKFGRMKQGLADVLGTATSERDLMYLRELYAPILEALDQLLRAGEASGDFAPGADPEDVLQLLGFLWRIKPDAQGTARIERLLDLVVRGLNAPVSPTTRE